MREYADSQNKVYIENGGIINTAEKMQMTEIVNLSRVTFCLLGKVCVSFVIFLVSFFSPHFSAVSLLCLVVIPVKKNESITEMRWIRINQ